MAEQIVRELVNGEWVTTFDSGGGGGSLPDPVPGPVNIEAPLTEYGLTVEATAAPADTEGVFRVLANDSATALVDVDSNGFMEINGTLDPFSGLKVTGFGVGGGNDFSPLFRAFSSGIGNALYVANEGSVEVGLGSGLKIVGPHAAPIDDSLNPGEIRIWFDQTNGAAKLMLKGKTADGTVVTGNVALT